MNGGNFFAELRRRNVYKVAVAYAIVAWLLIQIATQVFPFFEIPNWAVRMVVVLLVLGFPVALVLAWAFELTPQGIKRTEDVTPAESITGHTGRKLAIGIALLALLAAGLVALQLVGRDRWARRSASALMADGRPGAPSLPVAQKSIAVLPFENFSDDRESGHFGDGIQDDILTNLAKIADLKVISRTSVAQYRGKTENVREIGKALGVATVLEGSVRKAGDRVRVNVQLINAETDQHIWAEDYDRELTDVFAIQSDLAQKIAAQLQAKLSPAEKATLTQPPTTNGEAYLAYIQAHNLRYLWDDPEKAKTTEELYARAIELDPQFALAIAGQSILQSRVFRWHDPSALPGQHARELAEQALALQPDLPEGHLALGHWHYYLAREAGHFERALKEFDIAREGLPNDAEVYISIALVQRRMGKWNESAANFEKAQVLDPNSVLPLNQVVYNYEVLHDWNGARRTIERGLKLDPASRPLFWGLSSDIAIAQRGDLSVADKALEEIGRAPAEVRQSPETITIRAGLYMVRRKWAEALRDWESLGDRLIPSQVGTLGQRYAAIGICKRETGDTNGAHAAFFKACEWYKRDIAPLALQVRARYPVSLALLGEKEAALSEAKRTVEMLPESADALSGLGATTALAQVYALTGEPDRAVDLLAHLLEVPSEITPWVLKVSPDWDPLRGNPRFEELVARAR